MDRIDHATAVDIGGGRRGFRSKDTLGGVAGTVVTAAHLNAEQEEIVGFIEKTGQQPDGANFSQLAIGVRSQSLNYIPAVGGTANALSIALDPAPSDWAELVGVPLRLTTTAANTTTDPKLSVVGLPGDRTIVWPDRSQIGPASWAGNQFLEVIYDGVSVRILSGADPYIITTPVTKTVHGVGADFANLNAAFEWVSRRRITKTGAVLFNIAAGQHVYNGPANGLILAHPDGGRISVSGQPMINGGFPAFNILSVTGFTVGQRAADYAANLAIARSRWPTELRFTGGAGGFAIKGDLGLLQDLMFTNDSSPDVSCVQIQGGRANWTRLCAAGAGALGLNFYLTTSFVAASGGLLAFGGADRGISVESGSTLVYFANLISHGNAQQGFMATSGSTIITPSHSGLQAGGNVLDGIRAEYGSTVYANAATAYQNGQSGITAIYNSTVYCRGSNATGNVYGHTAFNGGVMDMQGMLNSANTTPVLCSNGSFMSATGGAAVTYSPALNTVGNANSFIQA